MSLGELATLLYDLVNAFQVALSSVELMELEPMPQELRKKVRIAKRSLTQAIESLRRLQSLVRGMKEEESESIQ